MPFTPAHVAAVLPLMGRERPRWAVPSALAIGSMVPDVLYFVPIVSDRELSHSLVGVVTLDLALGLLFVALWRVVAAPVVRDLMPAVIRARVPVARRPTTQEWLWSVPCLVLGALTHVVWDAFTHQNGWGLRLLPVLTDSVAGVLPAFKLAQYGSGVLGVAVVVAYLWRVVADSPPTHPTTPLATPRERATAWVVLVLAPALCGLGFAGSALVAGTPVEMLLYITVVRGVSGLGLATTAVALWWHARVRPRQPTGGPHAGLASARR